ncbi:MAG: energy transducer TonB [Ginsengibacter sp.]
MFKQIFFSIGLIFFVAISIQAQTQYSYYFDKDLNLVSKPSKAIFLGEGAYQNGLFELKVFDKRDKKLLVIEHFTDSSLAQSNGLFVSFSVSGNKELEGNYLNGRKDGLWKKWNWNGLLVDSSTFENGNKITETSYNFYPSGKIMSREVFVKDSLVSGRMFDEEGKEIILKSKDTTEDMDKIFTRTEIEASFPGGSQGWSRYIGHAITEHIDEFTDKDYGTCIIRFIVNKKGEVHDVMVMNACGIHLAKVGTDAIKNGPKWIPAQQNGRYVNAYRLQPITLQNPDE